MAGDVRVHASDTALQGCQQACRCVDSDRADMIMMMAPAYHGTAPGGIGLRLACRLHAAQA
eukprot:1290539-Rhodomonas_salina.3